VPRALKEGWQDFLWRYVTTRDTLIGLVLIVDARHGLRALDNELLAGFMPSGRPLLVLATKADKLNASARRAAALAITRQLRDEFGERAEAARVIAFSAASGEGVPEADAVLSQWLA
jgi:GTP-binding protein